MDAVTICRMALAELGTRSTITSLTDGSVEALYCDMYYDAVRDQALRASRWNFAKHSVLLPLWKALPGTPEYPVVLPPAPPPPPPPPSPPAKPLPPPPPGPTIPALVPGWNPAFPSTPWLYSYGLPTDFIYARSIIAQPYIASLALPLFPVAGTNMSVQRALRVPFEIAGDPYDQVGNMLSPFKKVLLTSVQTPIFEYTYQAADEDLWDSEFVMVMVLAMAARLAVALTGDKQLAQIKLQAANGMIQEARGRDGNEGVTVHDHMPDWLSIRGAGAMTGTLQYDFMYPYGPMFAIAV